jgi:uncharacterized protein YicC (UPF0701 family)
VPEVALDVLLDACGRLCVAEERELGYDKKRELVLDRLERALPDLVGEREEEGRLLVG